MITSERLEQLELGADITDLFEADDIVVYTIPRILQLDEEIDRLAGLPGFLADRDTVEWMDWEDEHGTVARHLLHRITVLRNLRLRAETLLAPFVSSLISEAA